jgi:sialic acid synthase SpsE
MRKTKIGNRLIGEGEPCFIIAEADFRWLLTS